MSWVLGADFSNHQRWVDGAAVASAGVKYAWHKVTEGTGYVDPYYRGNRASLEIGGVPVGGYHFARPGNARDQADFFVDNCGATTFPHALDLEVPIPGATDWSLTWLERVWERTGVKPVWYGGYYYLDRNDPALGEYAFWLPSYTANYAPNPDPTQIPPPRVGGPWSSWSIWQYTSMGSLPGVAGRCDLNVAQDWWFQSVTGGVSDPTEEEMAAASVMFQRSDGAVWEVFPYAGTRRHVATVEERDTLQYLGVELKVLENAEGDAIVDRYVVAGGPQVGGPPADLAALLNRTKLVVA